MKKPKFMFYLVVNKSYTSKTKYMTLEEALRLNARLTTGTYWTLNGPSNAA